MKNYPATHDRFFRNAMSNPRVAKDFFKEHLPAHIQKILDWEYMEMQNDSFVEDDLNLQLVDVLYKTKFNDKEGFLYVLVEHQSKPEKFMPFRVVKYLFAIMEKFRKKYGNDVYLPSIPTASGFSTRRQGASRRNVYEIREDGERHRQQSGKFNCEGYIYPVIFYSGNKPYNYSTSFFELFGENELLMRQIFLESFQIVDVNKIEDENIRKRVWSGMMLYIMKHIWNKNFLPYLKELIPAPGPSGSEQRSDTKEGLISLASDNLQKLV